MKRSNIVFLALISAVIGFLSEAISTEQRTARLNNEVDLSRNGSDLLYNLAVLKLLQEVGVNEAKQFVLAGIASSVNNMESKLKEINDSGSSQQTKQVLQQARAVLNKKK